MFKKYMIIALGALLVGQQANGMSYLRNWTSRWAKPAVVATVGTYWAIKDRVTLQCSAVDKVIARQKAFDLALRVYGFNESADPGATIVNAGGYAGYTRLHKAANEFEVQALIEAGADVNARNHNGRTPLHTASNQDTVQALIAAGADVNSRDHHGRTPLHMASDQDTVQALIKAGADVNARDCSGKTPLFKMYISTTEVQALVAAGADVNARDNNGNTPLHDIYKSKDCMKALIAAGADVNARNNWGETPLYRGPCQSGCKGAIKTLVAAGADVYSKNDEGKTAFECTSHLAYEVYLDEEARALLKGSVLGRAKARVRNACSK